MRLFSKNRITFLFGLTLVLTLVFLLPQIAGAQTYDSGLGEVQNIVDFNEQPLIVTIAKIIRIVVGFIGLIALILFIYAGFLWMTSAGMPDKIEKAKKIMTAAVIGMLIIVLSFAITTFIIKYLEEIGGGGAPSGPCEEGEMRGDCELCVGGVWVWQYDWCGPTKATFDLNAIETYYGDNSGYEPAGKAGGNPYPHQNDVYLCSAIQQVFNKGLDKDSIDEADNEATLKIEKWLEDVDRWIFVSNIEWYDAAKSLGNYLTLKSTAADNKWDEFSQYRVTIPKNHSANPIKDVDDNNLVYCNDSGCEPMPAGQLDASEVTFIFNTGDKDDTISPTVNTNYTYPRADDSDISRYPIIQAFFSEFIDMTTVEEAGLPITENIIIEELSEQGGGVVETVNNNRFLVSRMNNIDSDSGGFRVYLNIETAGNFLTGNTWHRITLKNITDLCGNIIEEKIWEFRTNGIDPAEKGIYPPDGFDKACADTEVFVEFNATMFNPETDSCEILLGGTGGYVIDYSGFVNRNLAVEDSYPSWRSDPNKYCHEFSFNPNNDTGVLSYPEIEYSPQVDISANHFVGSPVSWTFQTAKSKEECVYPPYISRIQPSHGPLGQCLTITGKYFTEDDDGGDPDNSASKLTINGVDMTYGYWMDTYITLMLPDNLGDFGGAEFDTDLETQVTVAYTPESAPSNIRNFHLDPGAAYTGPCLYSIKPEQGNLEDPVVLSGERFGQRIPGVNSANVVFNPGAVPPIYKSWSTMKIETWVPNDAEDGDVYAQNPAGVLSNKLPFNVMSCGDGGIDSGEVCDGTDFDGKDCTDYGKFGASARLVCDSCVRINTSGCLPYPKVWDYPHCDVSSIATPYMSPNPYKNTVDGCVNIEILAGFTEDMNPATFRSATFKVEKCSNLNLSKPEDCDVIEGLSEPVIAWDENGIEVTIGPAKYVVIADILAPNTWYRATVTGGPVGVRSAQNVPMKEDYYTWIFKTRGGLDCPVAAINLVPDSGNSPVVLSAALPAESFTANPFASNCNILQGDYEYEWSKVDISGATNFFSYLTGETSNRNTITFQDKKGEADFAVTEKISRKQDKERVKANWCDKDEDCIDGGCESTCDETVFMCRPDITGISPVNGETGTWVTIDGCWFGSSEGLVESNSLSWRYPRLTQEKCNSTWTDTQVIMESPLAGDPTGNLVLSTAVVKQPDYRLPSRAGDSIARFEISENSYPGLCRIYPASSLRDRNVTLYGKSFGSEDPASGVTFNPLANGSGYVWLDKSIVSVVPMLARSGDVIVHTGPIGSNPISLEVILEYPEVQEIGGCDLGVGKPSPNPPKGATNVCSNAVITGRFNMKDINGTTVTTGGNIVLNVGSGGTVLSSVSFKDFVEVKGFEIRPNFNLTAGNKYSVTVKNIEDTTGVKMDGVYSWDFTAGSACAVDNISVSPSELITINVWGTQVYNVAGTNQGQCIELTGDVLAHWASENTSIVRVSSTEQEAQTTATGRAVGETKITATVNTLFDSVSLRVVGPVLINRKSPEGPSACPNGAVEILFNQKMQASTLNNNTLKICKAAICEAGDPGVPKDIKISEEDGKTKVILIPKELLDEGTIYNIAITGDEDGVESIYGTKLAGNYTWSFTTKNEVCEIDYIKIVVVPESSYSNQDFFFCAVGVCGGDVCPAGPSCLAEGVACTGNIDCCSNSCDVGGKDICQPGACTLTGAQQAGNQHKYTAEPYDVKNTLLSSVGLKFAWEKIIKNDVVEILPINTQETFVTAKNKNGEDIIKVNVSGSEEYGDGSASIKAMVYLCENPWPSIEKGFPYYDDASNFSFHYCRGNAPNLLLPELNPIEISALGVDTESVLRKELIFQVKEPDYNPVAYWNFDENFSDVTGHGHNGIAINGAERGDGNFETTGVSFDGEATSEIQIPDLGISPGTAFSISVWVKPESTGDYRTIMGYDYDHRLLINRNGRMLSQQGAAEEDWLWSLGDGDVPDGEWTHIIYWYDGTFERWYINGEQSGPEQVTSAEWSQEFKIGQFNGVEYSFKGLIDEAAVYNRALLADEIEEHKNSQPKFIRKNDNLIGVRVFSNPNHFSPSRWYKEQGFKGSLSNITVDGYDGVSAGRTVYVGAANDNKDPTDPKIYSTIYLMSYTQNAAQDTMAIMDQLLNNWKFNTNIDSWTKACSGNNTVDCESNDVCEGDVCDTLKDKLRRDAKRVVDFTEMAGSSTAPDLFSNSLANYEARQNKYPELQAGTFIKTYSVSAWPSWNKELGKEIGMAFVDPINKFNNCGEDYDSATCWNDSKGEFVCPAGSHVYTFQNLGDSYVLASDFEYKAHGGVGNYGWFNFNEDDRFVIKGVCTGIQYGDSQKCGDKILGIREECEVGYTRSYCTYRFDNDGAREYYDDVRQACNAPIECIWKIPDYVPVCQYCGDTLKNGPEQCEGDATNPKANSRYNQYACGKDCKWSTGGWCGNRIKQRDEQCDGESVSKECRKGEYSGVKIMTCNDNCQWPWNIENPSIWEAPCEIMGFCGDGEVQGVCSGAPALARKACIQAGKTWIGETCDEGENNGNGYCRSDCTFCGDGIVSTVAGHNEVCDDGNISVNDTCDNSCQLTFCGDGIIQSPNGRITGGPTAPGYEVCDDKNYIDNDGCFNCALNDFSITSDKDSVMLHIENLVFPLMDFDVSLSPTSQDNLTWGISNNPWLAINENTGVVSLAASLPGNKQAGVYEITITACGKFGGATVPTCAKPAEVFNLYVLPYYDGESGWASLGTAEPAGAFVMDEPVLKLVEKEAAAMRNTSYLWIADVVNDRVFQVSTGPKNGATSPAGTIIRGGPINVGAWGCRQPSRTTVDLDGNGWVACRNDTGVDAVKINKDTGLQIGSGFNVAAGCMARGLAADAEGNVWVGCGGSHRGIHKITYDGEDNHSFIDDPGTPEIDERANYFTISVYGLAIDRDGHIWVSDRNNNKVGILNPFNRQFATVSANTPYGIGTDFDAHAWVASCRGADVVYEVIKNSVCSGSDEDCQRDENCPSGETCDISLNAPQLHNLYSYGCNDPRGVAIDSNERIWVTCDLSSSNKVIAIDKDGAYLGQESADGAGELVGITATNDGTVWAVNFSGSGSKDVTRFKESGACPDCIVKEASYNVADSGNLYSYSDMAGFALFNITSSAKATWTFTFDSKTESPNWTRLYWQEKESATDGLGNDVTTEISIKVSSSPDKAAWTSLPAHIHPNQGNAFFDISGLSAGRYLKAVFTFDTSNEIVSPEIDDIKIHFCPSDPIPRNNIVECGEQCDDGNSSDADKCSNDCVKTSCGDGIKQTPNGMGFEEACDSGALNGKGIGYCKSDCSGIMAGLEGNGRCNEGECNSYPDDCEFEDCCGDGTPNNGETCATCVADYVCVAPEKCCSGVCREPVCSVNSDCDDSNSCTTNVCNNKGTCNALCYFSAITGCSLASDGCCPAGCTSINDSDCSVTNGNNVCEAGECSGYPADCSIAACCGNGELNKGVGEVCDDLLLDGKSCFTTYWAGDLACTDECTFDFSGCIKGGCGDFVGNTIDLPPNGIVNLADWSKFVTVFGSNVSNDWTVYADYNDDGVINVDDFSCFSVDFGKSMACPRDAWVCDYHCGNGDIEGGEKCDDGDNNGVFGYCNSGCSGPTE